ncbi:MAG TPA: SET domain-containing protein-lysine N-methyltransferase [Polyangiaceae bacterium]
MKRTNRVVRVGKSRIGRGVFARKMFRKTSIIGEMTGRVVVQEEMDPDYSVDLGKWGGLDPARPFRFLNHCCEPNCRLIEFSDCNHPDGTPRLWVQALSTIRLGEELTIDYAWPAESTIECQCGSESCRGFVVDRRELKLVARRRRRAA